MHQLLAFVSLSCPALFEVLYALPETMWRLRIKKKIAVDLYQMGKILLTKKVDSTPNH